MDDEYQNREALEDDIKLLHNELKRLRQLLREFIREEMRQKTNSDDLIRLRYIKRCSLEQQLTMTYMGDPDVQV